MSPAVATALHRPNSHMKNVSSATDDNSRDASLAEVGQVQDAQGYQVSAYHPQYIQSFPFQGQMGYPGFDRPMYSAYPYPQHPMYQQQPIASGTPYIPPAGSQGSSPNQADSPQSIRSDNNQSSTLPTGTTPGTVPVTMFPTMISYGGLFPMGLHSHDNVYEGHIPTWNGTLVMHPQMQQQPHSKAGQMNGRGSQNSYRSPYFTQNRAHPTPGHLGGRGVYGSNDRSRGRNHLSRGVSSTSSSALLDPYDISNEQNRGPRTMRGKGQKHTTEVQLPPDLDLGSINCPNFSTKYEKARFFVIKSYSEDDVHKSIKYQVWASTPIGNKRLESAYLDSLKAPLSDGNPYPIFLLFSVNASGQFCGVAQMDGPVDHSMSVEYWQQDKWSGLFKVKWVMSKDVPNSHFRHIILANNENKPITNSRDTQEVNQAQGQEFLEIFKAYNARTSILDDFGFYDERQKAMQEKRNKLKPREDTAQSSQGSSYTSSGQSSDTNVVRQGSSVDSLEDDLHRLTVTE